MQCPQLCCGNGVSPALEMCPEKGLCLSKVNRAHSTTRAALGALPRQPFPLPAPAVKLETCSKSEIPGV